MWGEIKDHVWRCGGHGGCYQRGSRAVLESALLQVLGQERWVVSRCVYGPDVFIVTTNVPRSWHLDKRRTVRLWPCFPRPQYWTYIGHPGESGESFENWDTANLTKFSCRELTRNFEWAFQQSNYSDCLSTESEFSEKLVITLSAFNGSVEFWHEITVKTESLHCEYFSLSDTTEHPGS